MGRDASLIEEEEEDDMMGMKTKSHQGCDKPEVDAHQGRKKQKNVGSDGRREGGRRQP